VQWADGELSLMWRKLLSVLVDPDDCLPLSLVGDDGADPIAPGRARLIGWGGVLDYSLRTQVC
jgi:hypothetical protein